MLSNSLRTREVTFAYLFGPPRFVKREEASKVYDAVSDALSFDDLTYQYSSSEPPTSTGSRGFSISLRRKEGRGEYGVRIDHPGIPQPIRLLSSYVWPPSMEHVAQLFDATSKAVLDALEGEWQIALAEVRLKSQCDVRQNDGLQFMRDRILGLDSHWVDSLGSPQRMASVKFEIDASPANGDSLGSPKRELTIEVLREDPRGLYIEMMTQWSQLPMLRGQQQPAIDAASVRPIDKTPSEYVQAAHSSLRACVEGLDNRTEEDPA